MDVGVVAVVEVAVQGVEAEEDDAASGVAGDVDDGAFFLDFVLGVDVTA